jgi:hypothetical protein
LTKRRWDKVFALTLVIALGIGLYRPNAYSVIAATLAAAGLAATALTGQRKLLFIGVTLATVIGLVLAFGLLHGLRLLH